MLYSSKTMHLIRLNNNFKKESIRLLIGLYAFFSF